MGDRCTDDGKTVQDLDQISGQHLKTALPNLYDFEKEKESGSSDLIIQIGFQKDPAESDLVCIADKESYASQNPSRKNDEQIGSQFLRLYQRKDRLIDQDKKLSAADQIDKLREYAFLTSQFDLSDRGNLAFFVSGNALGDLDALR